MSLFRNAVGLLFSSAVSIVLGLATSIILARFLSLSDRGTYSLSMTFAHILVMVLQLGWPAASIYRLRSARSRPADVVSAGVLVFTIGSIAGLSVCLIFRDFLIAKFFGQIDPIVFFLAIAFVPLQLFGLLFNAISRGIDRFRFQVWYRLLSSFGTLGALGLVLIIQGQTLVPMMTALLALQGLLTLGLGVAVLRETGISLRLKAKEIRSSLVFSVKSYAHALSSQIHERIDIFMIAYFLADPTQVAFYAIAVGLVDSLKMAPEAIRTAAYPELASLSEGKSVELVCRVSRQSVVAVLAMALAVGALGSYIVPLLYGADYQASVLPLLILLPGMVLLTLYRVLATFFTAIDRQSTALIIQGIAVATNIGLNVVLIPEFGILGAAAASLASYALETLLIAGVFLRFSRCGLGALVVPRRSDFDPLVRRANNLLGRRRRAS